MLTSSLLSGQSAKYSNAFLSIGVGARAHGMGLAVTTTAMDATGAYWNAAATTAIPGSFEASAMHAEWFAGIVKYDYVGLSSRIKGKYNNRLSLSMVRMGIDEIPNTLYLIGGDGSINFDNVFSFSTVDYALLFSYAQSLGNKGLSVGVTPKIINRRVGKFATAWGFGGDLSLHYKKPRWSLGLQLRDVTTTFNAWEFTFTEEEKAVLSRTGNVVPESSIEITNPEAVLGLSTYLFQSKSLSCLFALDVAASFDGERNTLYSNSTFALDPRVGIEFDYAKTIALRAGVSKIQTATDDLGTNEEIYTFQPSIGVGLKIAGVSLDYAFNDIGDFSQNLYSHIFSLSINFKARKRKKAPSDDEAPDFIIEQIDY